MKQIIVDVREPDEYKHEHIEGSINLPMSKFKEEGCKKLSKYKDNEINILCQSGNRAKMVESMIDMHCKCNVRIYEGGLIKWKKEGKKTKKRGGFHIAIMRQVQIVAGGIVFIGAILAYFVNINFIILSGAVGLGLFGAGATGTCMLANILGALPFNRN